MGKLTGKYAIITGGGKGIGAAIVRRFMEDDIAGMAVLDYNAQLVEEIAEEFGAFQERIVPITCDVSNQRQVEEAVIQTVERFGTIDILVNNAGITRDSIFHKMSDEAWDQVLHVNLNGTYNLCKHVIPIMRKNTYGKIVNISSVSAFGNVGQANYAASKAALIGFSKTLAKESGPKNITVNCIAPGYINTDMYQDVPQNIIDEHMKLIPMQRLGEPDEIASAVAFLSSEDSSFLSGQCLIISGGATT